MAAYYKRIKGKNYDKALLDQADQAVTGQGDGRISIEDAKNLIARVKDSGSYSDIEKSTIRYIRDKYKFTKESDKWFRTEIRKWAATKSSTKRKTSKTQSNPTKKTVPTKKKRSSKSKEKEPEASAFDEKGSSDDFFAAASQTAPDLQELKDNENKRKPGKPFGVIVIIIIILPKI